ncbi:WYL domain-containing protein [Halosquirtibacter xylanolyticus]|uniref:helix-turn-helix transcriptional regulator n=1 Tax=Halosquirtibacter xylanolyticus TaxID=3374599 RepID=UPI0037492971|nr:WYL domain-containing protein [Prolixibacteraceae bacterium]
MANHKNANIRYQALDKCFRNTGKAFTIDDLLDACNDALAEENPASDGIQLRTLRSDIRFMRSPQGYDAPVITSPSEKGKKERYYYSDNNFTICNKPLTTQEAYLLKEAVSTLSRFSGLPQFDWLEPISMRLSDEFGLCNKGHVVSFEQNEFLTGKEHIRTLYSAVVKYRVVELLYHPFSYDNPYHAVVSPYFIKEYNNRWFLFGLNHEKMELCTFAFDRIKEVQFIRDEFVENDQINFADYFSKIVGVTVNKETSLEKVVLQVNMDLMPYIVTKPLHPSQNSDQSDKGIITLDVIPNYELEAMLLSFADRIEVLEPKSLRQKLKNRAKTMLERYMID